ncbi:unnamed protein product [Danaus chrysippus]|uniref:(African queen) hypothetical protein n=1 Tax=Danaus chrysippus TaxID=151541 RepID=A0A8J2W5X9_9NEOP|nr:unnamed protein product [Danaus chrysippus]
MKDTKAVYVTTYTLDGNLKSSDEITNRIEKTETSFEASNESTKDFGCQYDINNICTCKRIKRKDIRYYSSRQVYRTQRYLSTKDFTDIGVGDVKTLPRKRVRRIYLPYAVDAGVGSSIFTTIPNRTQNFCGSYYDQKKTSSKCVGGLMENTDILAISVKLSPIVQTKSGSNSPKIMSIEQVNNASTLANESPSDKTEQLQVPSNKLEKKEQMINAVSGLALKTTVDNNKPKNMLESSVDDGKPKPVNTSSDRKDYSSDSLVQHVHNLENPSDYKQSRTSIDFIENKLEREYRKIFSTKPKDHKPQEEKTASDFKSTSTLRRRFEALRRGINKKDEPKTDFVTLKISSRVSVPSKKDVSIVSDPPSLEARSYSNTKIFSPLQSRTSPKKKKLPVQPSPRKSFTGKRLISPNWSTDNVVSDQGVKGMFKLWGKKFNLDENNVGRESRENIKNKVEIVKEEVPSKEKKQGKRFSFFRRKNKEKSKQVYKSKKGVTAGRCEVDGLMIKIGAANEYPPEHTNGRYRRRPVELEGILKKSWLQRYVDSSVDSKHSAQIRWNNNMYTTSSSTVFELIDCVYKNTGLIFKSKSEMTTAESSYYQSFVSPQINFMQQSIQAWMIPQITRDKQIIALNNNKKDNRKIQVTYSNQKWFIEKSKAFGRNIEVVLHSKNFVEHEKGDSSEYIMIDIPEGYFSDTSSDEIVSQTSDEQVYNIVEYETAKSNSYVKKYKKDSKMDTGDYATRDIHVTVSVKDSKNNESNILETVIKRPPLHRTVVVQGSNVYVPKRCDVIGVGIITQRDIRDIKKPILKIQDELTDDSEHTLPPQKKCEFAESYLQDYYRNWTPLGIDMFSWCVSDTHLRGSSDSWNSLNQGDGSKSCPNIFDDYQASTIVSSCNTSSCSHCQNLEMEQKSEDHRKCRQIFNFKRKKSDFPDNFSDGKRVLPKDSLEVFKRRKLYALSNRAIWKTMETGSEPNCVPSNEDRECQNYSNECLPVACDKKPKKECKKHVSMPSCDVLNDLLNEQLSKKCAEGILAFKGAACDGCKKSDCLPKHARVIPAPTCTMPHHPVEDPCTIKRIPTCFKTPAPCDVSPEAPPCAVTPPSPRPCSPPSPRPCPPPSPPCIKKPPCSPPPCVKKPPCPSPPCIKKPPSPSPPCIKKPPCPSPPVVKVPPCAISKQTSPINPPCSQPRVIPPKVHSPPPMELAQRPCSCSPKPQDSQCNTPTCLIRKLSQSSSICLPEPPCQVPQPCVVPDPPCITPQPPCKLHQSCCSSESLCAKHHSTRKRSTSCQSTSPILKYRKCPSQEFPWPMKNQLSNTPSRESRLSNRSSGSCLDVKPPSCPAKETKKPKCPPAPKECPSPPPKPCKPKIPGLHLKKLPIPKCPSKDCYEGGVIRLSSRENITVKLKRPTDSTEEIRGACNIKVQDEDGRTMYERRNYHRESRINVVKDLYRDSTIHRVTTEDTDIPDENLLEEKIYNSVPNIIEINLNLKFKQGERKKNQCENCSVAQKDLEQISDIQHEGSKDVYLVQDQQKAARGKSGKKDLDIKITIKNFKPDTIQTNQTANCAKIDADEFSKNISKKFHTVSTGYSEVFEHKAFSVHRTTINLTESTEYKKQNKTSEVLPTKETLEKKQTKEMESDVILTKDSTTINTASSLEKFTESVNINEEKTYGTNDEKFDTGSTTSANEFATNSDVKPKSIDSIPKIHDKEEKKAVLKAIFENSDKIKKKPNKSKMENIKKMLRAVLTSDSSAHEDIAVNNELANELTYASLKPTYFKNSDSLTNYYLYDSSTSLNKNSHSDVEEAVYPSSDNTDASDDSPTTGGCLCSHFAAKLNIPDKNCCCCRPDKVDQEIFCNLIEDNYYKYKPEYVDVHTQDSKYLNEDAKSNYTNKIDYVDDKMKYNRTQKAFKRQIGLHPRGIKTSHIKRVHRATVLGISDDDKIIVLNSNSESYIRKSKRIKAEDILQSQETKKAVLEIYAEKTISNERIVAKLPKFVYNKESEICHYHEVVSGRGRSTISKRDVVVMSFI